MRRLRAFRSILVHDSGGSERPSATFADALGVVTGAGEGCVSCADPGSASVSANAAIAHASVDLPKRRVFVSIRARYHGRSRPLVCTITVVMAPRER